ncbi:MAG: SCO family protein [Pseudomonadota bacterium]
MNGSFPFGPARLGTGVMPARVLGLVAALIAIVVSISVGQAHNGVVHGSVEEAARHEASDASDTRKGGADTNGAAGQTGGAGLAEGVERALPGNTPGFPSIKGGDYTLIDQSGRVRTSRDPDGRFQLVFFGYANCQAICSVALPRMAETVERLDAKGMVVTPVLITVDPERDTVATLGPAVAKIHDRMVGLTGETAALQNAYDAFQVTRNVVFEHPEHGAVYAHGSYVFLLGPDGSFHTLMPPVLGAERMAEIVRGYISGSASN